VSRRRSGSGTLVAILILCAGGCTVPIREPTLHDPPRVPPRVKGATEELKAHLRSGELVVLRDWRVSPDGSHLTGIGDRYDAARTRVVAKQRVDVAVQDVALFETSSERSAFSASLGVFGTVALVVSSVTVYCTASPKSCFGSCPTFYVLDRVGREPDRPQAEGFSESIARALEARDVDALLVSRRAGSNVEIVMRNEALETHAVRRVRLLAAATPPNGRVLAGKDDRLYPATALVPPLECRAAEGDCLSAVRETGGGDRSSKADPTDLAARETVELVFPAATPGPSGIAIGARQTLLSTFLFYQTMAYAGRRAGELLASVERGGPDAGRRALGMARALGGIEVQAAEGDGEWGSIGSFDEAGPIAGDVRVVPFTATGNGPLRVRLRLARGHWRLDWVALATLGASLDPLRLEADRVDHDGHADAAARGLLAAGTGHLVTRPGDAYRLTFRLPAGRDRYELFLESEGYYYEWMRQEWMAEEDLQMAWLAVADPAAALRRLAPVYKQQEDRLEGEFWASRFRR
jgi:hypothetical protein